ncbi:hypothetical protein HPO96_17895 [Kribbella sandramycini]|uniref:Uncharacterized protein n=1 Tax=Kribbella sandramycini TaxID=60450 RepID=A0A7Y4L2Q8_9ACTN|nr:hypothetical protein [Kribbella sandramycini]MBB6565857.1 hypothetical protein [Kribbella sandramycini]NOL42121.1 hypothetical protein [Kribbella sandramycini]
MAGRPAWVWEGLGAEERAVRWGGLAEWVEWVEEAYAPWVVLPPCWPVHEGLRVELAMFWYWHRWVVGSAVNPADGVRWHNELRRSAVAWKELATCRHEPPVRHHGQIMADRNAKRDEYLAQAQNTAEEA